MKTIRGYNERIDSCTFFEFRDGEKASLVRRVRMAHGDVLDLEVGHTLHCNVVDGALENFPAGGRGYQIRSGEYRLIDIHREAVLTLFPPPTFVERRDTLDTCITTYYFERVND